jgi:hypothetical protein
VITHEVFLTEITRISRGQSRQIKKSHWLLDWHLELKTEGREVFKLTTVQNPTIIHGLISLTDNHDHVFLNLIENARYNKGEKKLYRGVAGNLVAFACKTAFERKYDGVVAFVAKTQLIEHHQATLGAKTFAGNRMFIDTREALTLVKHYFKEFSDGKS